MEKKNGIAKGVEMTRKEAKEKFEMYVEVEKGSYNKIDFESYINKIYDEFERVDSDRKCENCRFHSPQSSSYPRLICISGVKESAMFGMNEVSNNFCCNKWEICKEENNEII